MIAKENKLIIALTCSAFILMAILLVTQFLSPPDVLAAGDTDRGGDYVLTTARTNTGEEAVWLLDTRSRNIGLYQYDTGTRRLELRGVIPVGAVEQPLPR